MTAHEYQPFAAARSMLWIFSIFSLRICPIIVIHTEQQIYTNRYYYCSSNIRARRRSSYEYAPLSFSKIGVRRSMPSSRNTAWIVGKDCLSECETSGSISARAVGGL